MQISQENLSPTSVKLTVSIDTETLDRIKQAVLRRYARSVKIAGFREGKAPLHLVEKNIDQGLLQSEFLDQAMNQAYGDALDEKDLRPVAQPEVNITKFVPFTTLEFTATVDVVGAVKLPDYKKIKLEKPKVSVTSKDVEEVINNLKTRTADKKSVKRAAKEGDEVTIDFMGTDTKTKEPIAGADGKAYPLVLGSNTFIPGFEDHVTGLETGETKTFDITFPKEYGVKALQNRKVTFKVTVQDVKELVTPAIDDAFAATVGPFKTLADLKADIKKQITAEREMQTEREFQNNLLEQIADKTEVEMPKSLIENELDRMEQDERQNLVYRGQTWEEHLKEEGKTNEEHREEQREQATLRVKSGLMLAEVAKQEKVDVTDEEIDLRLQLMRGQYNDPQMQAELAKPEARRDIASRIVSEKTIAKLSEYATKKA